jgi:hypothetical protein
VICYLCDKRDFADVIKVIDQVHQKGDGKGGANLILLPLIAESAFHLVAERKVRVAA